MGVFVDGARTRAVLLAMVFSALVMSAGCVSLMKEFGIGSARNASINLTKPQAGQASSQADLPQLVEELKRSVVFINYSGKSDDYYDYYYGDGFSLIGSGVIYEVQGDAVYVLTNRHVVDLNYPDAYYDVRGEDVKIRTYSNDSFFASERHFAPDGIDLAILVFHKGPSELEAVSISDSLPRSGEEVLVIGMPEQLEWSVSKGIVSGIREFDTDDLSGNYTAIQTDAAVNEGNSGGGMFTRNGSFVGVNTWKYVGYGVEGLNFAISTTDFLGNEERFVSAPLGGPSGGGSAVSGKPPSSIGTLDVSQGYGDYAEDDWYGISFSLLDNASATTIGNGTARITIVDEAGKTLYAKNISVKGSDFAPIEGYPFSGKSGYTHQAYFSQMNKSESSDYADVLVVFAFGNKTFNETEKIYLADYLVKSYYDPYDYGGSYDYGSGGSYGLTPIGITASDGGVDVTLVEGGVADSYYGDYTLGISIKNTGAKKKEIWILDAALVSGGKQHEAQFYYDDDSDVGTVYPGAAVDKELLFYNVGESGGDATLYLELRSIEGESAKTLEYAVTFNT